MKNKNKYEKRTEKKEEWRCFSCYSLFGIFSQQKKNKKGFMFIISMLGSYKFLSEKRKDKISKIRTGSYKKEVYVRCNALLTFHLSREWFSTTQKLFNTTGEYCDKVNEKQN